ncbi:ARHGEF30 [Mytilus edulis]|uniref:OBSCN n=1 Tax=Mytilus edulis TaxID=6550 RepID=A0A8S3UT76_MYTED|nr:ARHGEF30 [Mytilus edulis]
MKKLFSLTLLLLWERLSQRYFLKDPSNIECYEGGEAIFICEVRFNSPPVKWKKGNNDLIGNDNYEISSKGEEQQLKLKRPKPDDSGEYFVHVGESFRKVQLNIIGYFLKDPSNIECYEGGEAIIICEVRSNSPPVKWKKGNKDLAGNDNYEISVLVKNSNLKLKRPKPDDSGEYFVHVGESFRKWQLNIIVRSNSPPVKWKKGNKDLAGNDNYEISSNGEEQQLKLKRPKPDDSGEIFRTRYFLKDPSNIECYEGGEAIFICEVRSNSPPVKWKKGNNDLAGNDNYEISSSGEEQQLKLKGQNQRTVGNISYTLENLFEKCS